MLSPVKFQQWYPQYQHLYTAALQRNCSNQLATYLGGSSTITHGLVVDNKACTLVQDCIWDAQDAHIQLDMSAATVLLGIAPAIISYLGPTLEETSLLYHRQPLLAFLIGFGTPAVHPIPPFTNSKPLERLYDQVGLSTFSSNPSRAGRIVGIVLEHLFAAAAAANIIWLGYDFSFRTVLAWGCNSYFHPLIWTLVSTLVFIAHAIAMRTRIQWIKPGATSHDAIPLIPIHAGQATTTQSTAATSISPQDTRGCIVWKPRTLTWAILDPLSSVGSVLILTYGTFIFASSYFVGSIDAITLVARIILSAITTRLIVAVEMSRLRDVEKVDMSIR